MTTRAEDNWLHTQAEPCGKVGEFANRDRHVHMDQQTIDTAVDEINDVIQLYNVGDRDNLGNRIVAWTARYCSTPFDVAFHPVAEAAIDIALLVDRPDIGQTITAATYDAEFDAMIRQEVNAIIQLANAGDETAWANALGKHIRSHWTGKRLMTGSFDILKVLRYYAIVARDYDLLPILDRQYYRQLYCPTVSDAPEAGVHELLVPGLPPVKLYSEQDCKLSNDIVRSGVFEPMSMELWATLVRDADVVADIGANIGIFSLVAAAVRSDVSIHAFEPNHEIVTRLRHNIEINGRTSIDVHTEAVSDTEGTATFRYQSVAQIGMMSPVGSLDEDRPNFLETEVTTASLDSLVPPVPGARLAVKVDTEGGEGRVLAGMEGWIDQGHIDLIVESYEPAICKAITDRLAPLGYRFYRILEGEHRLVSMPALKPAVNDALHNFNGFATQRPHEQLAARLPDHCRID